MEIVLKWLRNCRTCEVLMGQWIEFVICLKWDSDRLIRANRLVGGVSMWEAHHRPVLWPCTLHVRDRTCLVTLAIFKGDNQQEFNFEMSRELLRTKDCKILKNFWDFLFYWVALLPFQWNGFRTDPFSKLPAIDYLLLEVPLWKNASDILFV